MYYDETLLNNNNKNYCLFKEILDQIITIRHFFEI